ncbi:Hypothetical protein SMAX5B_002113 [Scophthalmus maximus]|uniref:Uncharacterized protein n=1 Tax=Scophthalmus maximus TaxID=52904 RepID=A0A2U9AV34_SCOMX|nr:Hypothetical protein SMAX5B_002113 [Scophthalmus maximus]
MGTSQDSDLMVALEVGVACQLHLLVSHLKTTSVELRFSSCCCCDCAVLR